MFRLLDAAPIGPVEILSFYWQYLLAGAVVVAAVIVAVVLIVRAKKRK